MPNPIPTDEPKIDKSLIREVACATCGEIRNLLDFYDNEHSVWVLQDGGVLVDHGEADPNR